MQYMNLKKKLLTESRIYLILDKDTCGEKNILRVAKKVKDMRNCIIQLREKKTDLRTILKNARRLKSMLRSSGPVFIVNDHADIAKLAGADGVHLGQNDLPVSQARKILGRGKIVGVSCHNLKQAIIAQRDGADYIGIGPVFSTPTKPEYRAVGTPLLKEVKKRISIPAFAIGGINKDNLGLVSSAGIKRIAVCRPICLSRNPVKSINELLCKLQ